MRAILSKLLKNLPTVLGVFLLFGAIYVVHKEFAHLKLADITASLGKIPTHSLLIAALWTFVSYWVLTFYDQLGTIYAGHRVSYWRVTFASFCAYTLAHNLGFAAVSGAAVRYRLYALWGLTPLQIGKVVAFCSLTFGLGGMVLGGVILVAIPEGVPFFGDKLPRWAFTAIGIVLFAIVLAYVTLSKVLGKRRIMGHEIELPHLSMAFIQVALATVDVAVTAAIFYTLLPPVPGLTFFHFLAVYLASYTAGLAATLPGGIGVFDGAMLLGLSPYLDAPTILGAIVVFRLYYYIIPLFFAGSLFTGNELIIRGGSLLRGTKIGRGARTMSRWGEADFAIGVATGIVALCGVLLMALSIVALPSDLSWIDPDFGDMAQNANQLLPSVIGAALMVLSIGLTNRVTLAWGTTLVLLLAAAGITAAQGQDVWIPGVLFVSMMLIAPFRSAFYRGARMFTGTLQVGTALPLFALVVCALALAAFAHNMRGLADASWWEIIISPELPNSVRFIVAVTVLALLVAVGRLMRPGSVSYLAWDAAAQERYVALGGTPPLDAEGLILGEAERAGIPFRRVHGVLLGLGEAGAETDRSSAIWRLRDLAAQEGLDPAVWRADLRSLRVYGALGLAALPLGPDGLPLPEQKGDAPQVRHYLCCVAERDLHRLLPLLPEMSEAAGQTSR